MGMLQWDSGGAAGWERLLLSASVKPVGFLRFPTTSYFAFRSFVSFSWSIHLTFFPPGSFTHTHTELSRCSSCRLHGVHAVTAPQPPWTIQPFISIFHLGWSVTTCWSVQRRAAERRSCKSETVADHLLPELLSWWLRSSSSSTNWLKSKLAKLMFAFQVITW